MIENLLKNISKKIVNKRHNKPIIIGINGVDGSGKSTFAKNLENFFINSGERVSRISIDSFHNPKKIRYRKGEISADAFYLDSINFEGFKEQSLKPLKSAKKYPINIASQIFNLESDTSEMISTEIFENDIVIFEGIFLFRQDMKDFFDFKIFIDADFNKTMKRMVLRDLSPTATRQQIELYKERTNKKYIAGQKLYFTENDPKALSDIIINNNDYEKPFI